MPSAKAGVLFRTANVDWEFTMGVANATGAFPDAAAAVIAAVNTNLVPLLSQDTEFLGVRMSDVLNKTTPGLFVAAPPATMGGFGTDALPQECCVTVTLYEDAYGRGRTGKINVAGIPKDQQSGGLMSPDYVGQVQTAAGAMLASLSGGSYAWHVVSTKDKTKYGSGPTDEPVIRVTARGTIRAQRRRQYGRSITGMHRGGA